MKKISMAALAAVVIVSLAGCGTKERDELKAHVASLQQELTNTKSTLATTEQELAQLRDHVKIIEGERDQAVAQTSEMSNELTRVKEELAAKARKRK
ncbi:MAG: hypothetical protein A2V90_09605 [Gammaproteobacteria bacterium RBG_16_57_12]|nr:MAG: hypothetical protein A2V90_09605 [Gammaproteobacteria bacterium RBG_16_57_12]